MAKRDRRLLKYAREMRRGSTWAETQLWHEVRGNQLGVQFRRQEPIGPYIADFACLPRRLIVEVDGSSHDWKRDGYDEERDDWFRSRGWVVIRLTENYVLENLDGALTVIESALADSDE